ncbi:hypothetical protein SAMN04488074_12774 [Lentzea albidocapillata subsp. violacea]|uniref:Uncharacterized protein n=2 Tax=Lentzea albidocapillata TaxID=40571 RepID=A0A1G9WDC5_9PSEU|nr:hypothetical protein SAMN04488074_12774 [Lentzea albidocapillata subsp. violacea]
MRSLGLLVAVAAGVTVLVATPATAQQQTSVTVNPTSGPAGSSATFTWSGFYRCKGTMRINWAGSVLATAPWAANGSVTATIPAGSKPATYSYNATDECGRTAFGRFTVTPPPPVTTTRPPVTTQPPVTNPPVTKPPVTTRPPVITTTTTPPVTTTTTTTTTDSSTPPSSSTTDALTDPDDGVLILDKDNIQPGDDLTATGTGCPKGANVTLKSLGQDVGRTTADENGEFRSPVRFENIEPGRHKVRAECGIVLVGNVDVTLSSSSGGTTSTLVVLLFFLLVGAAMLRRQFAGLRR